MVASSVFGGYFDKAALAYDFYDGNQWTDEEERDLAENGLVPVVSNQIAPRLNNVTGTEIITRTRLKFTSRMPDKAQASTAMTSLIMWLQEANESSAKWSKAMLKARIGGLAYHHLLPENDTIREEIFSGLDGFFDGMDRTADFSNSRGMGIWKWYSRDELKARWPKKADEIDLATNSFGTPALMRPNGEYGNRMTFGQTGYWDSANEKILVVYFYYRVPKKFYTYISKSGQLVNTFWKSDAEKDVKKGEKVAENAGYQVRQCVFSGTILYDEGEYPYQMDYYRGLFPLTPICLMREDNTGIPYGLVRAAIDDQRLYNKKLAKLNWLLSARQIVMDADAVDDPENLSREAARPDGIIIKKKGAELQIQKHETEIAAHYQSLQIHVQAIERNLGIFDEAVGAQTNASSGKAIQLRKSGSQTTQAMYLDALRLAKREAGRKMALMAQMKFTDQMVFSIVGKDGQAQLQWINQPVLDSAGKPEKDPDGNIVREGDITTIAFDVNLEEAPDTATLNQDAQQRLADMITAGVNVEAFTPGILKTLGIPEENNLYQEISQGLQQKLAQAEQLQAENVKLQQQIAKLTGQQIPGAQTPPAMPTGGVPGNVQ